MPVYYQGTDTPALQPFKDSTDYLAFQTEYQSAIDTVIKFYKNNETDGALIEKVCTDLDKFRTRIFSTNIGGIDQHALFLAKKTMEDIVIALTPPAKGVFTRYELNKKLQAIRVFAESSTVCGPGVADNMQIALQEVSADNITKIADNLSERLAEAAILKLIHDYKSYIRRWSGAWDHAVQRAGMEIHAVRAFKNAFSQEFGFTQQSDEYTRNLVIPDSNRERIITLLRNTLTEDHITTALAQRYLQDLYAIAPPGQSASKEAMGAADTLKATYGEHITFMDAYDVTVDEDTYDITGLKPRTDLTAIKAGIAKAISDLNGTATPGPAGIIWSDKQLKNQDGKQLWCSGDLFWQQDAGGEKVLPEVKMLGTEYINQIGTEQLLQVVRAAGQTEEEIKILSSIEPKRQGKAGLDFTALFLAKLTSKQRIDYFDTHYDQFSTLSNKDLYKFLSTVSDDPLAERVLKLIEKDFSVERNFDSSKTFDDNMKQLGECLITAIKKKNTSLTRFLINHNVKENTLWNVLLEHPEWKIVASRNYGIPLLLAIETQQPDLVTWILQSKNMPLWLCNPDLLGAAINKTDHLTMDVLLKTGPLSLSVAVSKNSSVLLNELLTQGVKDSGEALDEATVSGHTELVKILLMHDVKKLTSEQRIGYFDTHYDQFKMLDKRDLYTFLPAVPDFSFRTKLLKMIEEKLPAGEEQPFPERFFHMEQLGECLITAIQERDKPFAEFLINHTVTDASTVNTVWNVLSNNKKWWNAGNYGAPLLLAMETQQPDLLTSILLKSKINLSNCDPALLNSAINKTDSATMGVLLKLTNMEEVLQFAAIRQNIDMVNTLLMHGVRDSGNSLISAVNSENQELVKKLLSVSLYERLPEESKVQLYNIALKTARRLNTSGQSTREIITLIKEQQTVLKNRMGFLMYQKYNWLNGDTPLDTQPVTGWSKPVIQPQPDGGTSRFDGQLIIQLENDPVVTEAAARLAGKHPETTVLVQLDAQGQYRVVYGDLAALKNKKKIRWQLVGHGRGGEAERNHQTLGGRTPEVLAKQLSQFRTDSGIKTSPEHISLVGCSLASEPTERSYAHQFAQSLDKQGIRANIAARRVQMEVSEDGRKLTAGSNNDRQYKISEDKVVLVWNKQGRLIPATLSGSDSSAPVIPDKERELLNFMTLAEDFRQCMGELYKINQLSPEWQPVLSTVTETAQADSGSRYSVQFINTANPDEAHRIITTADRRIFDFMQSYNEKLAGIRKSWHHATYHNGRPDNAADAEAVHGLNSAFLVQAITAWFADKNRTAVAGDHLSAGLQNALRVHSWINLAQMGSGTIDDAIKLTRLLFSGENKLLSVLERGGSYAGVLLNVASIATDITELIEGRGNEQMQTIAGTNLFFDSAGLVIGGTGLIAGALGAETLAAVTNPLTVPLAGLGIGITGLVAAELQVLSEIQAAANYMADIDEAYNKGGYRVSKQVSADKDGAGLMENIPGAVIRKLDLIKKELTFGSQHIYRTGPHGPGSGQSNHIFHPMPVALRDKAQAINIRQGIGYGEQVSFDAGNHMLLLPVTPEVYINYDHEAFAFATSRHDRGFDIFRRLEADYRFDYDFYIFPSEYSIRKLRMEYVPTATEVILDGRDRAIIIPQLPAAIKGKMSYKLTGNGGNYRIILQSGVSLSLQSDNAGTRWLLDGRHLGSGEVTVSQNQLQIGEMKINLSAGSGELITVINNKNEIYSVDMTTQKISIDKSDGDYFKGWQALHAHLKQTVNHHPDSNRFVPVDNYQAADGHEYGRAFYETASDRFIYTRSNYKNEYLNQAQLLKTGGDKAWFYRGTHIWQTEIATGKVLRQYYPMSFKSDKVISSHVWQENNQLRLAVKLQLGNDKIDYIYHIEEESIKLIAIYGDSGLMKLVKDMKPADWKILSREGIPFFAGHGDQPDIPLPDLGAVHGRTEAVAAELVVLTDTRRSGVEKRYWLFTRKDTQHVVTANTASGDVTDLVLAAVTGSDKHSYYFYNNKQQRLYFQADNGQSGTPATAVAIDQVISVGQQEVASGQGTLWSLDDKGGAVLEGVTEEWLSHKRKNFMTELKQLADTTPGKLSSLRLSGMKDSAGKTVNAWYDSTADRVVLSGANLSAADKLCYLGSGADGRQAWIFDAGSQQLYRQRLPATAGLTLSETLVPSVAAADADAFLTYPGQKYLSASLTEGKLRLESTDGSIMLLPANADVSHKPTLIAFRVKPGNPPEQISKDIQQETDRYQYKALPAVRLLDGSGQAARWYLSGERKIIRAEGPDSRNYLNYLGQAAGQAAWYIHDQTTSQLWSVSETGSFVAGNYRIADLVQGSLALQVSADAPAGEIILPQLQGVNSLVIAGLSAQSHNYRFDDALRKHYQKIAINDRGTGSVIRLDAAGKVRWSLQRTGRDLILCDEKSGNSILLADIQQTAQRGMQLTMADAPPLLLSDLLTKLNAIAASDSEDGCQLHLEADESLFRLCALDDKKERAITLTVGEADNKTFKSADGHFLITGFRHHSNPTLRFASDVSEKDISGLQINGDLVITVTGKNSAPDTTIRVESYFREVSKKVTRASRDLNIVYGASAAISSRQLFAELISDWKKAERSVLQILGTDGDDFLRGSAMKNNIFADGGSDQITGNNHDDSIFADFAPRLMADGTINWNSMLGNGDDMIDAGKGNDIINISGGGKDSLIFRRGDGHDFITGFNGNSYLTLAFIGISTEELKIRRAGHDLKITVTGKNGATDDVITVLNAGAELADETTDGSDKLTQKSESDYGLRIVCKADEKSLALLNQSMAAFLGQQEQAMKTNVPSELQQKAPAISQGYSDKGTLP